MDDLLKDVDAVPNEDTAGPTPPAPPANIPEPPFLRFPPMPVLPDGVKLIPFKEFKECGIQIFSAGDVEIDGLGIPTVPLRVNHQTDKSKTNAKKAKNEEEEKEDSKGKKGKGRNGPPMEKLDPVARAQEQKRRRVLLFAKKEWYEQWAEGEDLRGTRSYDSNLSPIDRVHMAATEFRTGRIWPPGYMKVNYLWDQFRLYAGLLGSPPVWLRTDLPRPEEDSDDMDDETDSDVELSKIKKEKEKLTRKAKNSDDEDDDDDYLLYSDEDEEDVPPPRKQKDRTSVGVDQDNRNPPQARFKRIPARTPYALYNIVPIPVSSDDEVRKLLSISAGRRESRLLRFLADPELSVRVFLSWYLRHESLIWSPHYLVSFPHIVQFFLSFLVRVKALPESERGLKKAVEVAKYGIMELGRTGKLSRELPDKFGVGLTALYGKRWEEERWKIDMFEGDPENKDLLSDDAGDPQLQVDKETKEEALKRFEEELRAANVQILPADPANLGIPATELDVVAEETAEQTGDGVMDIAVQTNTVIEGVSANNNSSGLQGVQEDTAVTAAIPLPPTETDQKEIPKEIASTDATSLQNKLPATDGSAIAQADTDRLGGQLSESEISADDLDWSKPDGKINKVEKQAAKAAWESNVQPLMEIFGMSTLPLKYDAGGRGGPNKLGVAERSMRKVKAVFKPGEADKDRKWRGVEDDLIKRLSRVVLAPWVDWDNGGIEIDYSSPKVQGDSLPQTTEDGEQQQEQSKHATRYAHDPEKDDITVLMESHVADLVMIGMGMAGTFVQLVPARDDSPRTYNDRGRGRGRGRGGGGSATGSAGRPQKEFTFWYVEHLQLAIPSFWTAGEEEKPITREDVDEALELDLEVR